MASDTENLKNDRIDNAPNIKVSNNTVFYIWHLKDGRYGVEVFETTEAYDRVNSGKPVPTPPSDRDFHSFLKTTDFINIQECREYYESAMNTFRESDINFAHFLKDFNRDLEGLAEIVCNVKYDHSYSEDETHIDVVLVSFSKELAKYNETYHVENNCGHISISIESSEEKYSLGESGNINFPASICHLPSIVLSGIHNALAINKNQFSAPLDTEDSLLVIDNAISVNREDSTQVLDDYLIAWK